MHNQHQLGLGDAMPRPDDHRNQSIAIPRDNPRSWAPRNHNQHSNLAIGRLTSKGSTRTDGCRADGTDPQLKPSNLGNGTNGVGQGVFSPLDYQRRVLYILLRSAQLTENQIQGF